MTLAVLISFVIACSGTVDTAADLDATVASAVDATIAAEASPDDSAPAKVASSPSATTVPDTLPTPKPPSDSTLRDAVLDFWNAFNSNDPTAASWYADGRYVKSLETQFQNGLLNFGRMQDNALIGLRIELRDFEVAASNHRDAVVDIVLELKGQSGRTIMTVRDRVQLVSVDHPQTDWRIFRPTSSSFIPASLTTPIPVPTPTAIPTPPPTPVPVPTPVTQDAVAILAEPVLSGLTLGPDGEFRGIGFSMLLGVSDPEGVAPSEPYIVSVDVGHPDLKIEFKYELPGCVACVITDARIERFDSRRGLGLHYLVRDNGFYGLRTTGEVQFKCASKSIRGLIGRDVLTAYVGEEDRALQIDLDTGTPIGEWDFLQEILPGDGTLIVKKYGSRHVQIVRVDGQEVLVLEMDSGQIYAKISLPAPNQRSDIFPHSSKWSTVIADLSVESLGQSPTNMITLGPGGDLLVFDEENQRATLLEWPEVAA